MKEIKRAVCLMLCFVMVFGLLPVHANALDLDVSELQPGEFVEEIIAGDALEEPEEGTPAELAANTATGNLVGGTNYVLDTDGVDAGAKYLIVSGNSGTAYALRNNDGGSEAQSVSIQNGTIASNFTNESGCIWTFTASGKSWYIANGNYRIRLNSSWGILNADGQALTVSSKGDGAYQITNGSRYLRYVTYGYSGSWQRSDSAGNVYLFKQVPGDGAAVTFDVEPVGASMAPKDTVTINPVVTVDGKANDQTLSITWKSSDDKFATVDANGLVTAVAEGTATITATLTHIGGQALKEALVQTVVINVSNKKVDHAELTGNGQINVLLNGTPDYSNIEYTVTYDDDSTETFTVGNGLTVSECDTTTSGKKTVEIFHNGVKVGEVIVNVTVDFSKLPVADMDKAPEYPEDGAVRIDKTATHTANEFNRTGVTRVELDVAGISVESAVDVILIMDISNSMSWDDTKYDYNDTEIDPASNQRLNIARDSAKEFVKELMKDNGDNDSTTVDNTLTMLAFAGIDTQYNTHNTAKDSNNDDVYQVGALAMTSIDEANAALDTLHKATTGGTNYDYAFQQAYALAEQLHEERGNRVYIVFMTDGVPTHYNGVYYKSRNSTDLTACMQYVDPVTGQKSNYTSTGNDRNGKDIDSTAKKNITVYYNDGTTATKNVTYNKGWSDYVTQNKNGWAEKVKALDYVAHVYAIGFGMKNGSVTQGAPSAMPTLSNVNGGTYYIPTDVTHATLKHIASDESSHFEADNLEEMSKLYKTLATQIKFAGTEAVVKDKVDSNFSVQMTPYVLDNKGNQIALTTPPSITVTAYDLYPRGTMEDGHDVTGMRTGDANELEKVTFDMVDGKLCAYSNVIGAGVNILTIGTDGSMVINAKNFTYTKDKDSVEQFTWNIGNITDKEIALAFDVYLEGSMTGERPEGIYYTNEEATLEYVDINGQYAKKIFPIPGVVWGGASTTIRFYLVNEKGEPVNRAGVVVPWENRIYVGDPVVVPLNLNSDLTIEAQKIEAAAHVPSGFYLYDLNAYYTVQTTSSEDAIAGGITVSTPSEDAYKTTGTGTDTKKQNGAQTTRVINADVPYYTWSFVGFGVRWDLTTEKTKYPLTSDKVVIDYGKAIQIDVLANDPIRTNPPAGEAAFNRELVGFVKFDGKADLEFVQTNPGSATYSAEYGKFSVVSGKVQFQPTKMLNNVQSVYYAVRYTQADNASNSFILWGRLDVIPATIMYYETDFATGVFTTNTDWETESKGAAADGPQNDGTIGQNTYGFDSTYDNDAYLSNGSSLFAAGQGYDEKNQSKTYATFSFTGTGFDLISRTGAAQGLIRVKVFTDAKMTNIERDVSVLNKSESNLELYQIPVVSINDLPHSTYYVKIEVDAAFTNTILPALNRGNEFYFDAIRIYDPVMGNAIAEAAYNSDGEANNELDEVRQMLISANTFEAIDSGSTTAGMVYVDSTYTNGEAVGTPGNVNVTDYAKVGPNNEVYLSKNQAVAFKVNANSIPASFDIGAKSITGSTAGLKVAVYDSQKNLCWTVTKDKIESSTVQFIDLLSATGVDASQIYKGAYVVITNTGSGVLSITDLKTAFSVGVASVEVDAITGVSTMSNGKMVTPDAVKPVEPFCVSYTVDAYTLDVARMVLTGDEEPEVPEVPETPEKPETPDVDPSFYNIQNVLIKINGSVKNQKCTFTVVTSQKVEDIEIVQNGAELMPARSSFKDKKSGERVWTIELRIGTYDKNGIFALTGIGENGVRGASVTVNYMKNR